MWELINGACFASREECVVGSRSMENVRTAGLEIATHWSPMRPKIEGWRLDFQNWSPAGESRFKIMYKYYKKIGCSNC